MKRKLDSKGKEYWRSQNQLANDPKFVEQLKREFPEGASQLDNSWSRRSFIGMMGASLALAGLASCRRPKEKIVPYVNAPEEITPGVAQHYATAMPWGDDAFGLLVESHEGRPTKIEGNPLHPSGNGAASIWPQADNRQMYDPDLPTRVLNRGVERKGFYFVDFWLERSAGLKESKGKGLAVISEPFASPTIARLKKDLLKTYPEARWVTYEPVSNSNVFQGCNLATGEPARPRYDMSKASVVVSFDCDFLFDEADAVRHARDFTQGRNIETEADNMNRLYVLESRFTSTGAMADHRMRVRSSRMLEYLSALAAYLEDNDINKLMALIGRDDLSSDERTWLKAVAKDLVANKGKSLILVGRQYAPELHALAMRINQALGNFNETVTIVELTDTEISNVESLKGLTRDMSSGVISDVVILGANPVYDAPSDFKLASALAKVTNRIHLGLHENETAARCIWHVPQTHFLEAWSDTRYADGTLSVTQPLIEPLHGGKSAVELLALLATDKDTSGFSLVQESWKEILGTRDFEKNWRRVLHDGVYREKPAKKLRPRKFDHKYLSNSLASLSEAVSGDLELVLYPDAKVYDGRYANNGWLQELPDQTTKLTWDNAALMSPATAEKLGIENEDVVEVSTSFSSITIAAWTVPGMADGTIAVSLGYGREFGRIASGTGANAYKLLTTETGMIVPNVTVNRTGRKYALANVQDHGSMEGRPIIRESSLEGYRAHPEFARDMVHHPPLKSLWKEHSYEEGYQWGMAIDLNSCIGCNACTIACQSENNIPVIGREEVSMGREMHWIRVDRYFNGGVDDPAMVHQPVACQHCENAPCEQVCPVAATVHDSEGLNTMVYNRCIGTRYCANNCPYKVRRFNFFAYTGEYAETLKMAQNPDVTVRSRGVMEKCTYCLQRINRAKISAKNEGRTVKDGEIVTACQQTCPTQAIVFGNINDPESQVSQVKQRNRNYEMLSELNIKPRTSYLAKLRNPNPELVTTPVEHDEDHG